MLASLLLDKKNQTDNERENKKKAKLQKEEAEKQAMLDRRTQSQQAANSYMGQTSAPTAGLTVPVNSQYSGVGSLDYGKSNDTAQSLIPILGGMGGSESSSAASTAPSAGLGAGDYVGMGLSVLGAAKQDAAAEKEEKKADDRYDYDKETEIRRYGQETRADAQQQYQNNFNAERNLNFSGLDALAKMRGESNELSKRMRFKTDMLRAIKGGA